MENFIRKRIAKLEASYATQTTIEGKIRKGSQLTAFKQMLAYVLTHQNDFVETAKLGYKIKLIRTHNNGYGELDETLR